MKIAIVGTHGTGKTTLSYLMAAHYKKLGKNVKIIQEVARSCPFPINQNMTAASAKWIYYEHVKKELEAVAKHDVIIGDRSIYDSFVYAKYFNLRDPSFDLLEQLAFEQLMNYDRLIFVRPDIGIESDGVRSIDPAFQLSIDKIYDEILVKCDHIELTSSKIFDTDQPWKYFCI
jgi:thymidylate kinase